MDLTVKVVLTADEKLLAALSGLAVASVNSTLVSEPLKTIALAVETEDEEEEAAPAKKKPAAKTKTVTKAKPKPEPEPEEEDEEEETYEDDDDEEQEITLAVIKAKCKELADANKRPVIKAALTKMGVENTNELAEKQYVKFYALLTA